jgi:hypothetical protein
MTTVQQDARQVRKLRLKALKLKHEYDDAQRDFKGAQQQLYDRMTADPDPDNNMTSFRSGGVLYVARETLHGQVQDAAAFKRWYDEHKEDEGIDALFEDKPRKKLINELVRDCIRNHKPLPDGLGFYPEQYVSQRAPGETDDGCP